MSDFSYNININTNGTPAENMKLTPRRRLAIVVINGRNRLLELKAEVEDATETFRGTIDKSKIPKIVEDLPTRAGVPE